MGQVYACGQGSTQEGWASSMSCPTPAPGPHAGAQRRPGWRVPPAVPRLQVRIPRKAISQSRVFDSAPVGGRKAGDARLTSDGQELAA
jgi:hypothetical protein